MTQMSVHPRRYAVVDQATIQKCAGHVIVDSLVAHGVKRAHVVPGESFLEVLDGLHGSDIETIVCRHEGGLAYMAEADGKRTSCPASPW
jgi:acetolactate synthase-1/2/3 large subunit